MIPDLDVVKAMALISVVMIKVFAIAFTGWSGENLESPDLLIFSAEYTHFTPSCSLGRSLRTIFEQLDRGDAPPARFEPGIHQPILHHHRSQSLADDHIPDLC